MFKSLPLSTRYLAAFAPVMPHPIITTSASDGRSGVVLYPSKMSSGSECQNDLLELGTGSGHGFDELFSDARIDDMTLSEDGVGGPAAS
jgi:hypothetical protein